MSKLLMEKEVYRAAVNGDLTIFGNPKPEHLLHKTYENYNIIHIAAQHKKLKFIKAALNNFTSIPTCESLICDSNCHGDTSLHIAAMVGDLSVVEKLVEFFSTECSVAATSCGRVSPWRVKNEDGDTPAHVALLYCKVSVAMYLVEKDGYLAREINNSNETLLHLAIQYQVSGNDEPEPKIAEDIWPLIELLLKLESSVTCWANAEGLTPLHQATSLEPGYCLRVIKAMLASCPEAANVRDKRSDHTVLVSRSDEASNVHRKGSGHSMLHLLTNHQLTNQEQAKELLSIQEVYALKDTKNHQGDTPLHLAARNRDTIMVRILLDSSPNLGLKNKSGVSAASLIREFEEMRSIETRGKHKQKFSNEDYEAANEGNIKFLRERMELLGKKFLALQTATGQNILHLLMGLHLNYLPDEVVEFIGEVIQIQPSLIIQQDCDGNTYLHVLARRGEVKDDLIKQVQEAIERDLVRGELHSSPWRLKNVNGDTPLHLSAKTSNDGDVLLMILEADEEVATYVNNRKQTPIHLMNYNTLQDDREFEEEEPEEAENVISRLITPNPEVPYMQDVEGLTFLLAAVKEGNLNFIRSFYTRFPASSKMVDYKGRTLWHLIVVPLHRFQSSNYFEEVIKLCKFLIRYDDNQCIYDLMSEPDNDGNTPLHYAITNRQFGYAKFLLDYYSEGIETADAEDYKVLLQRENNEGVTPYNMIGSVEHLPYEFEKALFKKGNLLHGHRSMYGVPTTKIEEYANTIGVIAALLTTITFTAAFTVPGGVNSTNGTPLLIQHAMFQMFMVADIVAMCTSVMVLFCLLWIMTTGNKKESILLLDASVFLLQTSFYATLVTFMTGLYVTTISIVPAIAISTCVVCILLIILMHKRLLLLTVVPSVEILILLGRMLAGSINNCLSYPWSFVKKTKVDEMTPEASEVDAEWTYEVDVMTSEVVEVDETTSEIGEVDKITPEVDKVDKI